MSSTTAVTVSCNTKKLTALLLWSLHRILAPADLSIVVVDNGSTDGSVDLLRRAEDAGLCELLVSPVNLGHGPALDLALCRVIPTASDWVWILDSDCVITRPDALRAPLTRHPDAEVIGEAHWDRWHDHVRPELYSLLVAKAALDRPDVAGFTDGGDPSWELLSSVERAGLRVESFPFTVGGYLVHLGRASLAKVVEMDDRSNPLHEWAVGHHEPHYGGVAGAREAHAAILTRFEREVGPDLDLVAPLRR